MTQITLEAFKKLTDAEKLVLVNDFAAKAEKAERKIIVEGHGERRRLSVRHQFALPGHPVRRTVGAAP